MFTCQRRAPYAVSCRATATFEVAETRLTPEPDGEPEPRGWFPIGEYCLTHAIESVDRGYRAMRPLAVVVDLNRTRPALLRWGVDR